MKKAFYLVSLVLSFLLSSTYIAYSQETCKVHVGVKLCEVYVNETDLAGNTLVGYSRTVETNQIEIQRSFKLQNDYLYYNNIVVTKYGDYLFLNSMKRLKEYPGVTYHCIDFPNNEIIGSSCGGSGIGKP